MPAHWHHVIRVKLKFEPRDLWLGLYVDTKSWPMLLSLYLCLIPCLPVLIQIMRAPKGWPRRA